MSYAEPPAGHAARRRFPALLFALWLASSPGLLGAGEQSPPAPPRDILTGIGGESAKDQPPAPALAPPRDDRFQFAFESAVNFGVHNPNRYVTNPYFLTLRWQPYATEQFFHTPYTFTRLWEFGAVVVPFLNGPENHYFGLHVGTRLIYGKTGSRWSLYVGGRFAVGAIDSSGPPHGQGEDLTFNGIVTGGVQYQITPRQQVSLSLLYQHFSNGGLSEPERPNIGLNTLGPMVGWDLSF